MNLSKLSVAVASTVSAAVISTIPASASELKVQSGDSLWSISRAHHIPLKSLEAANSTVDPMNLGIGYVLKMPTTTASPSATQKTHTAQPMKRTVHRAKTAQSAPSVDALSLYWMAHLIHAEAGGEPYRAQVAVGDVVMHRVHNPQYPNTVKGVVFQVSNGHYQFTCVQNQFINKAPAAENYQAARDVLEKHVEVIPGAEVFYNPSQTSSTNWVRKQPTVANIGSFVFAH
jgi:N-acetylmuramoyl-L-alanine amidase